MTYVIFEVKSDEVGKINKLTKDDLVSRQSILTRDSSSLNMKGEFSYVKVEGSNDGIKRANELGVLIALIIGPDEVEKARVTVKNMVSEEQQTILIDDLIDEIYRTIDEFEESETDR